MFEATGDWAPRLANLLLSVPAVLWAITFHEFCHGYALTVHKSQGSAWDNVLLFDESRVFRENADKHLYTGITRAAEKVTVVV